jgi:hypothetical protein
VTLMTRNPTAPARHLVALPSGHQLDTPVKATTALAPGDKVHVAGFGAFAVAAAPIPLPPDLTCVPLAWERLAILAARDAQWDAVSAQPPTWRHRPCRSCGGTGRCS